MSRSNRGVLAIFYTFQLGVLQLTFLVM
jgi:hypothetical protein